MDERALLAKIAEAPDDDAPRLVFADHLADAGDPRGELTHVQCALAKGPGSRALRARERELLPEAEARWHAALGLPRGARVALRRGMVEHVTLPPTGWEKTVAKLGAVPLRGVTFHGGETEDAVRLFGDERLARFSELGFLEVPFGRHGLAACAASPHLAGLRSLRLGKNGIGAAGATTLFASKVVPALDHLAIEDNGLHSDGMEALARGPWLKTVRRLELHRVNVNTGWQPLERAKAFGQIRELHLTSTGVFQPGNFICSSIAASKVLRDLSALTVARHSLETGGLKHLAKVTHSQPHTIDLSHNIVGPQAIEAFVTAKVAARVRVLDLSFNKLGDRGAKALLVKGALPAIEELRLSENGISPALVEQLHARYGDALVLEEAKPKKPTKKRAR